MIDESQIGTEDATEEEQAQYEAAMEFAMRSIHEGKSAKTLFKVVANEMDMVEGIARGTFMILRKTEVKFDGLEDAVKIQLAEDILQEIMGLMMESDRLREGDVDDKFIEAVISRAYAMYQEDAERRGGVNTDAVKEDLMLAGEADKLPQGVNAMSTQEVQARGLMG